MLGYLGNIEKITRENTFFRKVLFTGKHCQLVVMCLNPGEEIGSEVHDSVDQFFRIETGVGEFVLNGEIFEVKDGFSFIVPAGSMHNLINKDSEPLKLYTVYSPPNHPSGTIHKTKEEADAHEKEEHK